MAKKVSPAPAPVCSVTDCTNAADYVVYLEDYNPGYGGDGMFSAQDRTCPFICRPCAVHNEVDAVREGRGSHYPYTKGGACGWTTYRKLTNRRVKIDRLTPGGKRK